MDWKSDNVNKIYCQVTLILYFLEKRQKQASKRDYYKILGVRRNAGKKEINKSYRKLAQKWHPDNFQDEEEKKKAEKKFMDIAGKLIYI